MLSALGGWLAVINLWWFVAAVGLCFFSIYLSFRRRANIKSLPESHQKYIGQAKRAIRRVRRFSPRRAMSYLRRMSPYAFEELVLLAFEDQGYKVRRNQSYSHDGGIDGQVRIRNSWYFIQSKRYSNYINANHVKDFDDLCKNNRTKGYFIHTGKTGSLSKSYTKNTVIISGDRLLKLMGVVK